MYSIESEGKSVLYGTDTFILAEETWKSFRDFGLRFDICVLDLTYGPDEEGSDHLNAHQVEEHVVRTKDKELLSDGGSAYATHIAHQGNPAHSELSNFASNYGYQIAYDGLMVSNR